MRNILACVVLTVVGALVLPFLWEWTAYHKANPVDTVNPIDTVITGWLEAQRKGRDGCEFWLKEDCVDPVSLFAVSDYEIVDESATSERVVRIHSSTRSGTPIVKLYRIFVRGGGISSVKPQGE